ncbi:MAG TPA: nuclear transport factor 2 family protein [Candidatus Limnocylindria bacterium]
MGNRQVVEQYARALAENDLDAQVDLLHDDYVARFPQSGEVVRGRDNYRAIIEHYPTTDGRGLASTISRIVGTDDAFVSTLSLPTWSVVHLSGSGDDFTITGLITYPNGETWHVAAVMTLLEGRIWRSVEYYGAPFDAPEWRAPFVELEAPAADG